VRSVTIDCPGTTASFAYINAPDAIVIIRGVALNGVYGATDTPIGVQFINGSALHLENCTITGFANAGESVGVKFSPPVLAGFT
jgi:hypothetical protein